MKKFISLSVIPGILILTFIFVNPGYYHGQCPTVITNIDYQINVGCYGESTGMIILSASGGTSFTYNWEPGNPDGNGSNAAWNLSAGIWTCYVTNECGNSDTVFVNITEPAEPVSVTIQIITPPDSASCNGSAVATGYGGDPAYIYVWSPSGYIGSTIDGLCDGSNYIVTVTDNNGCAASAQMMVAALPALVTQIQNVSQISCYGADDGSISINPSGGSGNYTFDWEPGNPIGDGTNTIDSLAAGIYSCTITDYYGDVSEVEIIINEPEQLINELTLEICSGDTILVNDVAYYSQGIYFDTLTSVNYCDSILIINLIVYENPLVFYEIQDDTVCDDIGEVNINFGWPSGGNYSGSCSDEGVFDTNLWGTGTHFITYSYTDNSGCTASVLDTIQILDCAGIDEMTENINLIIFPVPASDILIIDGIDSDIEKIQLILNDNFGKELIKEEINNFPFQVNLASIPAGFYEIKIINGDKLTYKTVVIE